MKKRMIIVAAILSTALIDFTVTSVYGCSENNCEENHPEIIENYVRDRLSDYYWISNVDIELAEKSEGGDIFFICADGMLKYSSVSEEPYFHGMMDALNMGDYDVDWKSYDDVLETIDKDAWVDEVDISDYHDSVAYAVWEEYRNLDSYVGKYQELNMYIMVDRENNIYVDSFEGFVKGYDFVVFNENQQYEWGKTTILSECDRIVKDKMDKSMLNSSYQNRSYAINYMKTYTSNPTYCSYCGSFSCSGMQNTSYWNISSYPTYVNHNDCASYVSQALLAGGHSTDSSWYYWSNPWKYSDTLYTYLSVSGKTTSTTMTNCYTGDLAFTSDYGHVMMVTEKDGTTPKISGHTHDRKNCLFSTSILSDYIYRRVVY